MKNNGTLKAFTFLSVLASAICYFIVPYIQYPEVSGSWFTSKITYSNLSCADIFYNADKFGLNSNIMGMLIGLVIISIILIIALAISKRNSNSCFALVAASQILSVALNGYLFYSFDNIKNKYAGFLGLLLNTANVKFVYGIYINIGLAVFAIILSFIGIAASGADPNDNASTTNDKNT